MPQISMSTSDSWVTRIVALLLLSVIGSAAGLYWHTRAERDRYALEAATQAQRAAALADSARLVVTYADRLVMARTAINEKDSLLAISQRIYDEVRRRGGKITSAGEVLWAPTPTTGGGTVSDDRPLDDDSTSAEPVPLEFTIDEETAFARLHVGLTVHAASRRLDYTYSIDPKPNAFRFFTVEQPAENGLSRVEIWVDVPGGTVQQLRTYTYPRAIAPPTTSLRQSRLQGGGRLFTLGRQTEIGAEVGVEHALGPLVVQVDAGYGFLKRFPYGSLRVGLRF